MRQSYLDTDIGTEEFQLLRNQEHIEKVWKVMKSIVNRYIDDYLDGISHRSSLSLQDNYTEFLRELIGANDKARDKYLDIFNPDVMEEYSEDTQGFKDTILKKQCDVIRRTLQSKSETLNEWKNKFRSCNSQTIYDTFCNMISFAEEYDEEMDEESMREIDAVDDCGLARMDEEACYQSGVLGYGIVSNILNHMYPRTFPGNYKAGVWSLYFLSDGENQVRVLGLPSETSEFCMVKDKTPSKTGSIEAEHNYFFPYEVYFIYTIRIYRLLAEQIAEKFRIEYPSDYRFLLTNSFYEFITSKNREKIITLAGNDDVLKFNTRW